MSEIWMPIPNYEKYEASTLGNVRSLNYLRTGKTCNLKPQYCPGGYQQVSLSNDGKVTIFLVHRLVMLAFVGECPEGLEVAHLNGVRDDNRLENLAYVTPKENRSHKVMHGTNIGPRGEKHAKAKLTEDGVRQVRHRLANGETQPAIAQDYGVSQQAISDIKTGKLWGWLD